jgi:hypothetical protein
LELVCGENAIIAGAKLQDRASGRRVLLRKWLLVVAAQETAGWTLGNSKEFHCIDRPLLRLVEDASMTSA